MAPDEGTIIRGSGKGKDSSNAIHCRASLSLSCEKLKRIADFTESLKRFKLAAQPLVIVNHRLTLSLQANYLFT